MSTSSPIDFRTLKVILPYIKDAVLLRGPHGIGKSAVPAARSKELDRTLLDVRLSLFTEGDLIGVPNHEKIRTTGVTTFAPPDWLHDACSKPCILFLDEINRATPGVQNSAFQLVLDREVKGWRLHPETLVFAAINDSPEYNVNEMDPALLDRFVVYDLVPTVQDWIEWAIEEGLDDIIVDFIRQHPEHLRAQKAVEPGTVTPTQRSWARLAKTLSEANMNPINFAGSSTPAGFYAITMGYIGVPTAIAFVDFIKTYDQVISATDVLNNYQAFEKKIKKLSSEKILGLNEKLAVWSNTKSEAGKYVNKFSESQQKNLGLYVAACTDEQVMHLWSKVGSGNADNTIILHQVLRKQGGRMATIINGARSVK
jgi:hypothetical protein